MSKVVTVAGTNYNLADQGTDQPWGQDESDLIQALVDVANSVTSPGDILPTTYNLANNITSPVVVTGLQFNIATVLGATVTYSIYRATTSQEASEHGTISLTYKPTANTFDLAQNYNGQANTEFTIDTTGRFLVTTNNMTGGSYVGTLKFSAKTTNR